MNKEKRRKEEWSLVRKIKVRKHTWRVAKEIVRNSLNVIITSFGKGSSEMEPSFWSFYSNKRLKSKRSNSIQKK